MKLEQVQVVAEMALKDGLNETTLGKLRGVCPASI